MVKTDVKNVSLKRIILENRPAFFDMFYLPATCYLGFVSNTKSFPLCSEISADLFYVLQLQADAGNTFEHF